MKNIEITWLGHSAFKIKIGNQNLLIDPWLKNNPMFPNEKIKNVLSDVNHILISHSHEDHFSDVIDITKNLNIPVIGIYDFVNFLEKNYSMNVIGFNKGGTVRLGNVNVTMVSASHSSSFKFKNSTQYGGSEAGYMIEYNKRTIYFSGDTDVMADMEIFQELHNPEIGILSSGGHFTMDMKRVLYATKKFFKFKTLIPCHYKTFPILEQSAKLLVENLQNVNVIEPKVLEKLIL